MNLELFKPTIKYLYKYFGNIKIEYSSWNNYKHRNNVYNLHYIYFLISKEENIKICFKPKEIYIYYNINKINKCFIFSYTFLYKYFIRDIIKIVTENAEKEECKNSNFIYIKTKQEFIGKKHLTL